MSDNFSALRLKSSKLADLLTPADDALLRAVALKSAAKALYVTEAQAPLIQKALEQVEDEKFDDEALLAQLSGLADEVEAPYLDALDGSKPISEDDPVMVGYRQARAITALSLAMSQDIRKQAGNAVYEALYAGVHEDDVVRYAQRKNE